MKINRNVLTFIMIAALVAVFAFIYYAYQELSGKYLPDSAGGNTVYEEAPDFTLTNINGEEVTLSDYRGKAVILNFWASWCPPCRSEMGYFDELSNEYEGGDELAVLMVNLTDGGQETVETASSYLEVNGFTLDVLFDTEGTAASLYSVSSIPVTYFIDKDGYIRQTNVGAMEKQTLRMEVTKLLTSEQ